MKKAYLFLCIFIGLLVSIDVLSQESGGSHSGVVRKQEKKLKSRWTLAEWMDQKQKMKWQDQWLAMNLSDDPYEFFIGAESAEMKHYLSSNENDKQTFHRTRGQAGAYASIIGIEGSYEALEKNWSAWDASLNLRLFGTAQQNTNITLLGGLKTYSLTNESTKEVERYQNPFAGVGVTLYINKFFGLEGQYRKLFEEKSNFRHSLKGENSRALLFIDFSFVRVYGGWNREYLIFNDKEPNRTSEVREGYMGGMRIWF